MQLRRAEARDERFLFVGLGQDLLEVERRVGNLSRIVDIVAGHVLAPQEGGDPLAQTGSNVEEYLRDEGADIAQFVRTDLLSGGAHLFEQRARGGVLGLGDGVHCGVDVRLRRLRVEARHQFGGG